MAGDVFKLVKHTTPEGKTRLDIESTGCEGGKHLFTPLSKRGPRKGLPKPGQRCCCGHMAWREETREALDALRDENEVDPDLRF